MSDFKETCIWMSYRYAIGRKSIASVSHAEDIARHIDWIPEDRREFTARDIIREINDKIKWYKNIHIDSYTNDECDIFTVIFEWFLNNPQEDPQKFFAEHEWYVNLSKGEVVAQERENPPQREKYGYYQDDIFTDYHNYKGWVNLAKFLKGTTHNVTVYYDGETKVMPCIEWNSCTVDRDGVRIEKHFSNAEEFPNWYIASEYIKNVEKIENGL